jgi:DNA-binding response OmpR family regulator
MSKRRVIIIEDDRELCELLAESLEDEGFSATYTHDPVRGERLLREGTYDTLLLDYKMPGLSGTDILKRIKADNLKLKIYIVSGRPFVDKILEDEDLSSAVNGILTKPIDFELLLAKLRQ